MKRLLYVPLEAYKERYTMQWSAPHTGWLERNWINHKVNYKRISPEVNFHQVKQLNTGSVVDATGRTAFCFAQIQQILSMLEVGEITNNDVIYFDDFWTPGLEALPYAFHLHKVKPKMFAFLHAQSVDEFDFTHDMRHWMRNIEKGFADALDGIFVCGPCLADLVVTGGIAPSKKVYITGHPFNSQEVMERMPQLYRQARKDKLIPYRGSHRPNRVVWSSRFDSEKNPHFFMDLIEKTLAEGLKIEFLVCTSSPQLRSNDPTALERIKQLAGQHPGNVLILEDLSKEEYYHLLTRAKVQFNCANQDFVAITLLEAAVAGCFPIYPYFRSFPETFLHQMVYMYQHLDLEDAFLKLKKVMLRDDLWKAENVNQRSFLYRRFDYSWIRMLNIMDEEFCQHIPFEEQTLASMVDPYSSTAREFVI